MCLIYIGCIGCHCTPSLWLMSLNVMTSLNVMVLSSQYGRCLQSQGLHYQKHTFRNERYARKRIYHGCEGQLEKSVLWDHSLTLLGNPRDRFFCLTLTPMIDSYIAVYQGPVVQSIISLTNSLMTHSLTVVAKVFSNN